MCYFFDDEEEPTPTNKVVVKIGLMLVEQRLQRGKIEKAILVFKRSCFASGVVALDIGKQHMTDGDKGTFYCVHLGRIFPTIIGLRSVSSQNTRIGHLSYQRIIP